MGYNNETGINDEEYINFYFFLTRLFTKTAIADFQFLTGNNFLPYCKQAVNDLDNNGFSIGYNAASDDTCIEYLAGSGDLYAFLEQTKIVKPIYCVPTDVTTSQAIRIITKFMEDNPDKLNKPAAILILQALSNAYPCHK